MNKIDVDKLRVMKDFVVFHWIKPKQSGGFIIPDQVYKMDVKPGKIFIGRVIKIGPEVKEIKKGEAILVHEYAPANFNGSWEEDFFYFIEEKEISATIDGDVLDKIIFRDYDIKQFENA